MKQKQSIPQSYLDWIASLPVAIPPVNWENTPESKLAQVNIAEMQGEHWKN